MGNRASISFKNQGRESVTLFSHWGGKEFQERALKYAEELKKERDPRGGLPLDRLDPETVIVDFIRFLTWDDDRVESNYYLGTSSEDGDNNNNGHRTIDLGSL